MQQRWDGSYQSSNAPVHGKEGTRRDDYAIYRCMVIDVLYVDDARNVSKNSKNPEVLYEVVILGGFPSGQTLSFCRLASYLGGDFNNSERILRKTSKDISKVRLEDHDGDIVLVQFNQGHDAYPVIVGMANGLHSKNGATKADGPRFTESYNGLKTTINNKGEFTQSMLGGKTENGFFNVGTAEIIKEEWTEEKIVRTYKSGMVVTEDGKADIITIKTASGVLTTIDGKGNKISIKAGSTEVLIDGGSGKISLKGEMIDLGSSVSDFVTQFTQLATAFNTHTHQYSPGPSPPVPTSPPMAPLLSVVGSQTVKVQP